MHVLNMFAISLLLTWLIEIPIGFAMGLREKKYIFLMLLVNLLTNPAAVLLYRLGIPQIPIELAVVIVEAVVYRWFSTDESWNIRHPIMLSLVLNLISWTGGILIQL